MIRHATDVIDVSAWTGTWPYDLNGPFTLSRLADRLARSGVREALVSPLDAVLAPDVMPANRALVSDCAGNGDLPVRFHPVPVINPALPTWQEELTAIVANHPGTCPAVRLLPTWHGWGLDHPDVTAVLRAIHDAGMTPIVQARMIDERAMPVSASPQVFDAKVAASGLAALTDVPVVVAGLYRTELPAFAGLDHIGIDLSFVESNDTLATVLELLPPERILPGTHAPMHEPLAGVAKLPAGGPDAGSASFIARESARDWFPLPR